MWYSGRPSPKIRGAFQRQSKGGGLQFSVVPGAKKEKQLDLKGAKYIIGGVGDGEPGSGERFQSIACVETAPWLRRHDCSFFRKKGTTVVKKDE